MTSLCPFISIGREEAAQGARARVEGFFVDDDVRRTSSVQNYVSSYAKDSVLFVNSFASSVVNSFFCVISVLNLTF